MADNKFMEGPGGRLQRAQADATRVHGAPAPIVSQYSGKMLPEVVVEVPSLKTVYEPPEVVEYSTT